MISVGEIPLFLLGVMMLCRFTEGELVSFVDFMSCNSEKPEEQSYKQSQDL